MSQAISMLTDAELSKLPPPEDSGFGSLATEKGNLPLAAVDVLGDITGLAAHVRLKQTFVNTHGVPLEATYIFPMPDRAAVTRFVMTVGGRMIEGVLEERGAARANYDAAIQAGHRAAIAEEERPGTFTMRVGNLMPNESATVHLEMSLPLPYSDGEATFRFPLVVAPRYIPGAPLPGGAVGDGVAPDTDAVPDASRITPPVLLPGFPNPVKLSIALDVDPGSLSFGSMKSSLHAITSTPGSGKKTHVEVQPGEKLNRDFILRIGVAEKQITSSLSVKDDAGGESGTFVLTLVPPSPETIPQRPREVVFVLDRSGSMGGWKMVAARRAMARMIDTLTDHDRFTVYAFDDSIETPDDSQPMIVASDRNRYKAVEFLAKVDARGGTEMAQPLDRGVKQLASAEAGRDRILVLVTDGQVGNEDQILRTLAPHLHGMRIFTVGIDRSVNEGFLKRLAAAGAGAFELVESEDRLDEVMDRIHKRIGTPVLTELKLEPAGLKIDKESIVPLRFPALFAGSPLVISGRYKGKASGGIALGAKDAHGQLWSATLSANPSENAAVGVIWARGWLREMEDKYVVTHDSTLEGKIVQTSLAFGVLCRFTAFVAIDKSEVVNAGGNVKRVTNPVESPDGWAMFDGDATRSIAPGGMPPPPPAASAMRKRGGIFAAAAESLGSMMGGGNGAPADGKVAQSPARVAAKPSPAVTGKVPAQPAPPANRPAPGPIGGKQKRQQKEEEGDDLAAGAEALDLSGYQARAKQVLALLEGSDPTHLLTLGAVTVQLAALVEDLTSIGAPADVIAPLAKVLEELRKVTGGSGDPKSVQVKAVAALEGFVKSASFPGAASPKPAGRSKSFWK